MLKCLNDIIISYEKSGTTDEWKAALKITKKIIRLPIDIAKNDNDNIKRNVLKALAINESNRIKYLLQEQFKDEE